MMLNVGGQQVSMSATRPSYTFFSRTLTRAAKKDIYLWFKLRSEADAQVTPSDIQAEFRRETEQDAEAFTKAVMDMAARAKQEKLNQ